MLVLFTVKILSFISKILMVLKEDVWHPVIIRLKLALLVRGLVLCMQPNSLLLLWLVLMHIKTLAVQEAF